MGPSLRGSLRAVCTLPRIRGRMEKIDFVAFAKLLEKLVPIVEKKVLG